MLVSDLRIEGLPYNLGLSKNPSMHNNISCRSVVQCCSCRKYESKSLVVESEVRMKFAKSSPWWLSRDEFSSIPR
jgi:hypothetical protein